MPYGAFTARFGVFDGNGFFAGGFHGGRDWDPLGASLTYIVSENIRLTAKYPANGGSGYRVTISELLRKRGYATGHFGKWNIGPEAKPGVYGFDVDLHMRAYLAQVKTVDDEIGSLLQRLDKLGLRENTIIALSSDQGPAPLSADRIQSAAKARDASKEPVTEKEKKRAANNTTAIRLNAMGYAGPFRGGKHEQYEGGVRISFIVRWPRKTPAGRVDEQSVISGADWLPTLCAIIETEIVESDFDGEDASSAFLGRSFARTKPLLWQRSLPKSAGAIRIDRWKLHQGSVKRGAIELFDIVADPGETTNLAAEQPDVVKSLATTLGAWQAILPKEYDRTNESDD